MDWHGNGSRRVELRIGADEDVSCSAEIRKTLLGAEKRLWNLLNLYATLVSQLRRDQVGL